MIDFSKVDYKKLYFNPGATKECFAVGQFRRGIQPFIRIQEYYKGLRYDTIRYEFPSKRNVFIGKLSPHTRSMTHQDIFDRMLSNLTYECIHDVELDPSGIVKITVGLNDGSGSTVYDYELGSYAWLSSLRMYKYKKSLGCKLLDEYSPLLFDRFVKRVLSGRGYKIWDKHNP